MRIGIGSDGSGFELKEHLKLRFIGQSHTVEDVGTCNPDPSGYHNVADDLASAIQGGRVNRGVLICSSAIGASIGANKHAGVRAALCHELYSAQHGVQEDNMNLLVLGSRVVTNDLAYRLADAFISASPVRREHASGIPPRRLARIIEHIRTNLDRRLEVSELSNLAEMSKSYFSRLFKLSTGLAPHQFILHERISRSKELLRQGKAKIVDIALDVGFENQAHFTTVFGTVVGMTPRQFQRSLCYDLARTYPASLSVEQYS